MIRDKQQICENLRHLRETLSALICAICGKPSLRKSAPSAGNPLCENLRHLRETLTALLCAICGLTLSAKICAICGKPFTNALEFET